MLQAGALDQREIDRLAHFVAADRVMENRISGAGDVAQARYAVRRCSLHNMRGGCEDARRDREGRSVGDRLRRLDGTVVFHLVGEDRQVQIEGSQAVADAFKLSPRAPFRAITSIPSSVAAHWETVNGTVL